MPEPHQCEAGQPGNGGFNDETNTAGKAVVRLLGDLQIIVVEPDQAEAQRHPQHDPDVRISRVCPQ